MVWLKSSPDFVDPISWRDTFSLVLVGIPPVVLAGMFIFLTNSQIDANLEIVNEYREKLDEGIVPTEGPPKYEASWGMVSSCVAACLAMAVFVVNYALQFWKFCEGLRLPRTFSLLFLGMGVLFFLLVPIGLLDLISQFYPSSLLNRLFDSIRPEHPEFVFELAFPLFWGNLACLGVILSTAVYQKYFRRPESVDPSNSRTQP